MSEMLWRDQEVEHNWFAIQLKPNSFRIAERSLLRQDFRVFCPRPRKPL